MDIRKYFDKGGIALILLTFVLAVGLGFAAEKIIKQIEVDRLAGRRMSVDKAVNATGDLLQDIIDIDQDWDVYNYDMLVGKEMSLLDTNLYQFAAAYRHYKKGDEDLFEGQPAYHVFIEHKELVVGSTEVLDDTGNIIFERAKVNFCPVCGRDLREGS